VTSDGISVIIPAYDVDGFIDDALASVVAQPGPIREILAVDDGSTDGTAARLRAMAGQEPRLRLLASDRRGPSGARNAGLREATQPIIAFIDGDDIWQPGKIRRQLQRLAAADRPDVVSGLVQRFRRREPGFPVPADALGKAVPHVNLGACLFRREVFDRIGLFDERLWHCEDVDLMFRVREAGLNLVIMREVTLLYRIRPGSLTQAGDHESGALAALRRAIARRRRAEIGLELPPFISLLDP
jgi:glycosyltransferase involved in cell wall biosynthesis